MFDSFWIDPIMEGLHDRMEATIMAISPRSVETLTRGGPQTLHVSGIDEVMSRYGDRLLYASGECLIEMKNMSIGANFLRFGHQYSSACLANVRVVPSGFDVDTIRTMAMEIGLLGGDFQAAITEQTSVLVVATAASKRAYEAISSGVPVVSIAWLHACFKRRTLLPFNTYAVSPFFGCKLCSSDISWRCRTQIARNVKDGGGLWSDSYDETVTFLVAQSLTSSRKVTLALTANVPVVRPEWIMMSAKRITNPIDYCLNWWSLERGRVGLFKGMTFEVCDNVPEAVLVREAITETGGVFSEVPQFRVVQDGVGETETERDVSHRWIWRCISGRKFIDPKMSITFTPFRFSKPVYGLAGLVVSVTNFVDDVRLEISDVLRSFGVTVLQSFSKNANVVIVEKWIPGICETAIELGIPIVDLRWFLEIVRTGRVPADFKAFEPVNHDFVRVCDDIRRMPARVDCSMIDANLMEVELNVFTQLSAVDDDGDDIGYDVYDVAPVKVTHGGVDPLLVEFGA